MSKFRRSSLKYSVDEKFFDRWAPQMAYVLGFTFADGNIHRTSLSWDIQKRDLDILEKIGKALHSTYPISEQRETSYRLRINNQKLIEGAMKKGLLPKKSFRLVLPSMPNGAVRHFVRGYLDGDGWVTHRSKRNEIDLGFSSGNESFLGNLSKIVEKNLGIPGKVRVQRKITPRGVRSTTYSLDYYSSNAVLVADWLYKKLKPIDIYLERKYRKYLEAEEIYNSIWSRFRSKRVIQRQYGRSIKEILSGLNKKGLNGMEIAKYLATSKSSVYRWLESTGVRYSN